VGPNTTVKAWKELNHVDQRKKKEKDGGGEDSPSRVNAVTGAGTKAT